MTGRFRLVDGSWNDCWAGDDILVNVGTPQEGRTWHPGVADLRLKEGSKAIDAGVVLPQITDGYTGQAPDPGCYELGS